MLFSIIYFVLIFFMVFVSGTIPFILLKRQLPLNPFISALIGFSILGLLSQVLVVFGPLNSFTMFVVIFSLFVAIWRYWGVFNLHFANLQFWFKAHTFLSKLVMLGLMFVIAYQGSIPTKINDMGMYYLQTFQWMEKYGIVKGLGNLHPALGLGSAWHSFLTLTNAFNQGIFQYLRFYGINGVLLLIYLLFVWEEIRFYLSQYKQVAYRNLAALVYLITSSIAVVLVGFFYLTAPSADFPILVFIPTIVYWSFFSGHPKIPVEIRVLIAVFLFACKPPAFLAVIISILLFAEFFFSIIVNIIFKGRKSNSLFLDYTFTNNTIEGSRILGTTRTILKRLLVTFFLVTLSIGPVLYKNYYQTGYLLYPSGVSFCLRNDGSNQFNVSNCGPKWKIPKDWNNAYRVGIQSWGTNDRLDKDIFEPEKSNIFRQMYLWIQRPGYKGFFNKLLFINVLLGYTLLFLLWLFHKDWLWKDVFAITFTYAVLLSFSILEWYFLRQYRLMLPTGITLMSFNVFLMSFYVRFLAVKINFWNRFLEWLNLEIIRKSNVLFLPLLVLYSFLAFFPFSVFNGSSRNKQITRNEGFNTEYLILPAVYQPQKNYSSFKTDSLTFNYNPDNPYSWNCPIPAISIGQQYFVTKVFHYQFKTFGPKINDGYFLEKDSGNTK